ncbi:MAG TPA: hypothetical protein VKV28_09025 [Candidatus Binataceae bacterium]|nr:hypothetical protein [Candidatus Binataceae bacterium]
MAGMVTLMLGLGPVEKAQPAPPQLSGYAGRLPDSQFLNLPAVNRPLHELLGARYTAFRNRFQVLFPIGLVGRDLVAEACVRSQCATRRAAFALDLDTGKVAAAFFTRHTFEIYGDADHRYLDLPPGLRHWITRVTDENSPGRIQFQFR